MFLFNDPKEVSDIELVHDRALPTETSVGIPLAATVCLGVGGFVLSANPIVGGALAAVPMYAMFKRFQDNWKNNAFERRNPGCVAHLVKLDTDMITWIEHHGVDEVRSQLLCAVKHRQKLTPCAKRALRALVPDSELPAKRVEQFLASQPNQTALPPSEGKRITTGLGEPSAITVSSEAVPTPNEENRLLDTLINNPYQCRAILAGQRSGKTLSAAVATSYLAKTGTWIGYINLFDHNQGNAEMMSHANCVISNLTALGNTSKAHDVVNDAINLIETFYAQDDAILVIDEWISMGVKTLKIEGIGELWTAIANKATALSSQGVGSGKAIWGIAPFFKAESVHDPAKSLKLFAPLVLAIAPGQVVHWTNPKTGKQTQISYNAQVVNQASLNWSSAIKDPTDEQARLWKRQGDDRIFWWNGHWNPIGELPVGGLLEIPKSESETVSILDARQHLEASLSASEREAIQIEADPAIELIHSIENPAKREAMVIAYQWARNRIKDGKEVDKASFMARARNDRNCDYLREHRDSIWNELEALIS